MVTELRVLRIRKGLNQEELAKQLNVTRNSVSAWERGTKPSLDNAKKGYPRNVGSRESSKLILSWS